LSAPAVLVVGASRGIGLEFVRQYLADGARVIATHRDPVHAAPLRALGAEPRLLDVLDQPAIARLGRLLAGDRLSVAIVNAGLYGPRSEGLVTPSAEEFDAVMHTNVLAAMRLIPVLAPPLAAAGGTLAVLSSRMGSASLMHSSSGWLYRASKAALNAVLKAASIDLGAQGIVCLALHPGWVRTSMGGPAADIGVAASVAGLRQVIAAADASANGGFFNYDGGRIDW
jgi:NAD(P)-dependent dehydrogenase (short-subunit alcohol dehydrogenase family)